MRFQDGNGQKATPGGIFPCAIDGADSWSALRRRRLRKIGSARLKCSIIHRRGAPSASVGLDAAFSGHSLHTVAAT
jgi:hypothetical protein